MRLAMYRAVWQERDEDGTWGYGLSPTPSLKEARQDATKIETVKRCFNVKVLKNEKDCGPWIEVALDA